ncbi:MAG TPA: glycosyltransferase [Candidatus Acidoferrales bacterium]|nr:glycosyltransferase [Candidatus Acidoferrales bacterium]HEV2340527.1 glycosyltransferase [Candidatus Acidoferrales bacterium]
MVKRKPIFYDEERRRWRRTRRFLEVSGVLFTLLIIVFFFNVLRRPNLPELLLPERTQTYRPVPERGKLRKANYRPGRKKKVAALGNIPEHYDALRAAFYVNWDSNSLASLELHYHDIDLLIPEELHASTADGSLAVDNDPKLDAWLKTLTVELPMMPLLNNYDGSVWQVEPMAQMLANPSSRQRLGTSLVNYAQEHKDAGIAVDFEEVPDTSQKNFNAFIRELGVALHAANLKLMVALPAADWTYDYKTLAQDSDAIILMNYDFHWPQSAPGSIVSQDWYLKNLRNILKIVPPQKIVMGIANYAYDWPSATKQVPHPVADALSFQSACVRALESDATIQFDPASLSPFYNYEDENNNVHNVWMLDALTAYNELRAAERADVRGTVLWRFGTEDPSIWDIWDATHPTDAIRSEVETIPPGYDLILEGAGDLWRITATPQKGERTFQYDPSTDTFTDERITKFPLSYRIERAGAAKNKLALTFDDGPDPRWTPQILNVLEEKHVPATFFVIGVEVDRSPSVVRREYAAGDEIGNHTYTHPDFEVASKTQIDIELNLTQRLLESDLGVKTLLFRPPYGIDEEPETEAEVSNLPIPQSMGYLLVAGHIDPHDWGEEGGTPPPPVTTIVQRVVSQAQKGPGNIILLHDGGGDRSHTVAALPQIIDQLEAKGYQFTTVSELLGQTRAEVMPPLSSEERFFAGADSFIFGLFHWLRVSIAFIFVAGILLVSGRALFIGLLALAEKLRPAPKDHPEYKPLVSVLIPAYNEESVIVDTVRAALASRYAKLEVLVVDDGSIDRTSELVLRSFGRDTRVRLLRQANYGKSAALNHALAEAKGEVVVTIDADTIVDPDAVPRLVRHFANPRIAAVAGNVKVINRNRWLTRWQALEYITSQNLEKRAFDLLNCIPVVPGAVGAWRAEVMRSCGGFAGDTVAEDTDLTLAIRRHGWRIIYDEDAIGRTEVPDTIDTLLRQRFRWTFGTLQAVWKHRDAVFRPRYGTLGWITIPNVFLFQIVLPLVSPIIDFLFLLSIVLWGLAQFRITHVPPLWTGDDVVRSLIFFAAFMLIDLFTCVVAFALEKHEDWTLLIPLLIQRFYYRQMMYVVLFRALKEAVQGRPVGWRGVEPHKPELPEKPAPVAT